MGAEDAKPWPKIVLEHERSWELVRQFAFEVARFSAGFQCFLVRMGG